MKCPKTLTIEHRKNAKVQSRYIQNDLWIKMLCKKNVNIDLTV
jgi:hypothetical protein